MTSNAKTEPSQAAANCDMKTALYPLRFQPIYQYRIWGGRRLAKLLSAPLPADAPIGEAWLLSDRDDHPSLVADGPLKGKTLGELLAEWPEQLMGRLNGCFPRFPLLLKFLDVQNTLSVQVHPSDQQAKYIPKGESGKTEAWVVLEAGKDSRIYAGLKPGTTKDSLQQALASGTVADCLASFTPKAGDTVLIPAGTVHSLGDLVVFEVQENSDMTFRLFDWDHIDKKTGKPRSLQVDQALACIDYAQEELQPVVPIADPAQPNLRERLIDCQHFGVSRLHADHPVTVGVDDAPRVLVCIEGRGQIEHGGDTYAINQGDVLMLPAVVGACLCKPSEPIILLEVSLPNERASQ